MTPLPISNSNALDKRTRDALTREVLAERPKVALAALVAVLLAQKEARDE